jgi:hypothetical protein
MHHQQPRQMLFTLRSTVTSSLSIASSSLVRGRVAAEPVVTPEPDDCAVPALLVPGGGGELSLAALPAPLGSLPALAGPEGAPLTPAVPAPVEPAFGEPSALPVPPIGPLAAPPVPAPPPVPVPVPPPLWANDMAGVSRMAITVVAIFADILFIGDLLFFC